jgi:hypothetical protein
MDKFGLMMQHIQDRRHLWIMGNCFVAMVFREPWSVFPEGGFSWIIWGFMTIAHLRGFMGISNTNNWKKIRYRGDYLDKTDHDLASRHHE